MASDIEICNLALSHLGDTATVASINPPEGSAQAEHCARFYVIARDVLLSMHNWNFNTRRAALTLTAETNAQWAYVYAVPNKMIKALAVIPADASDDYNIPAATDYNQTYTGTVLAAATGTYTPQPFAVETLSTGTKVICTNQEDAVLRYTQFIEDSQQFSMPFVLAMSWLLASMLAGPVLRGDVGAAEGKRCYQMFLVHFAAATTLDTEQRKTNISHIVPWLSGR